MYIKLENLVETNKAYKLDNIWLPKSILNINGLKYPYFEIQMSWVNMLIEKLPNDKSAYNVLKVIDKFKLDFAELPKDIQNHWLNYWRCNSIQPDYEPRLWGNDVEI